MPVGTPDETLHSLLRAAREQVADLESEVIMMEACSGEWAQRHREHALDLLRGLRNAFQEHRFHRVSSLCGGMEELLCQLTAATIFLDASTADALLDSVDALRTLVVKGPADRSLDPTAQIEALRRFAGSPETA